MAAETATQRITVAATLSGVVLTLVANAYLEHRWDRATRELERLRLGAEHARWLRGERLKAYAALSTIGEEVLQFIRSDLLTLVEPNHGRHEDTEARWRGLRTELRKAYNHVALFGAEGAPCCP